MCDRTTPSFPQFVLQLPQEKDGTVRSYIFSFQHLKICPTDSGYGSGSQLCHLPYTSHSMITTYKEEHEVVSTSLPLSGLSFMLKQLQL